MRLILPILKLASCPFFQELSGVRFLHPRLCEYVSSYFERHLRKLSERWDLPVMGLGYRSVVDDGIFAILAKALVLICFSLTR